MVDPVPEKAEEKPLDPAVARVQARLQRLMLIAGLTLGLGILAVFGAIVYRITAADDKAEVASSEQVASAPAQIAATPAPARLPVPTAEAAPVAEPPQETALPPDPAPAPVSAPPEITGQVPVPVPSPRLPLLVTPGQVEVGTVPPATDEALLVAQATVPADARLVASTVAGGRIVLTYDHFAGTIVMIVDPETLQVVGRLDLKPE
jgi:hypothetical protein